MKKSLSLFLILIIANYIACSNSFSKLSAFSLFTQDIAKANKKKIEIPEIPTLSDLENSNEDDDNLYPELKDDGEIGKLEDRNITKENIKASKAQVYRMMGLEEPESKFKAMAKRIVPEAALKSSPNLHYAYGEYKMPTKMWYYHKKHGSSIGCYSECWYYNFAFVLPTQMKELDASTQFVIHYRSEAHSNGYWPGFIVELYIDDEVIAKQSTFGSETSTGFYDTYPVNLTGKLFNVPAGNHRIRLRISSPTNNYKAAYPSISGHGSYYKTEIVMVGYPSS